MIMWFTMIVSLNSFVTLSFRHKKIIDAKDLYWLEIKNYHGINRGTEY
jgi:hypothetical protein